MSLLEAVILGIVQGLTEFLPISSTAHLRVVPAFFGWADPGVAYSAVIQLGSVLAVVSYFWRDLSAIVAGSWQALKVRDLQSSDLRLLSAIVIGSLPICVIGLLLKSVLEQPGGPLRSLILIAVASIVMGILLLIAERTGPHSRRLDSISLKDGLLVGLGQALALIPGCSRSGSTLTVALMLKIKRDDAARFSFLLGVPAIVLSGLLELRELLKFQLNNSDIMNLAVGLVVSLIVSYLSIAWLLKFLANHSTWVFIIYRFVFGSVVLVLALNNLIR